MNFEEINPYVRFVRTQKQIAHKNKMVALDNRIFYCISETANDNRRLHGKNRRRDSLVYWSARCAPLFAEQTARFALSAVIFDLRAKEKNIPVPPVGVRLYRKCYRPVCYSGEPLFCRYFAIQGAFHSGGFEIKQQQMYSSKSAPLFSEILVSAARLKNLPDSKKQTIRQLRLFHTLRKITEKYYI